MRSAIARNARAALTKTFRKPVSLLRRMGSDSKVHQSSFFMVSSIEPEFVQKDEGVVSLHVPRCLLYTPIHVPRCLLYTPIHALSHSHTNIHLLKYSLLQTLLKARCSTAWSTCRKYALGRRSRCLTRSQWAPPFVTSGSRLSTPMIVSTRAHRSRGRLACRISLCHSRTCCSWPRAWVTLTQQRCR